MLRFRCYSFTLLIPGGWINSLLRHRYRLLLAGILLVFFYQKDIHISWNQEPPATAGPVLTHLSDSEAVPLSVVPANFWSALTGEARAAAPARTAKQLEQLSYVRAHAALAEAEMHRSGVPASITLAQALLESNVGKSTLATRNHNHFGIKCFSRTCTKGHCSNHSDDSHKDFFRIYPDVATSFRAHSDFLKNGKRYRSLFQLDPADYQGWAHGLKKAGYATDKRYAHKLIRLIEDLDLTRYDR